MSEELIARTGFSRRQLEQLRARFDRLAGDKGFLSQEDFDALRDCSDASLLDTLWGFHHFVALDRNRSGRVFFHDFALGVASVREVAKGGSRVPHGIFRRGNGRTPTLEWQEAPRTALVVAKWRDENAKAAASKVGGWLLNRGVRVLVESHMSQQLSHFEVFDSSGGGEGGLPHKRDIDLLVCLGGDGTLLHACSMFDKEEVAPPCVSFGLGSLGFLTPFRIEEFEEILSKVLAAHSGEGVACSLRNRLRIEIFPGPLDESPATSVYVALNECLIDRGATRFFCQLNLKVDGRNVTAVQADGLIVATPSGSTAYSLSAGGSMIAPSVAGILLTPLAPHTLSFRPVVVDSAAKLEVSVPETSRNATARVTVDGRTMCELGRGGSVCIEQSMCPVPLVNMQPCDTEWFQSISEKLHWNERREQKPLPE